jgi:CRISPR-associated protein Csd1
MILKALYDYYNRCGDLAPTGMEYKEISFLVVIDEKGNFKHLERRGDVKNGQKFLVMKGVRSGTTPKPYLFWDNVEYVFDYCKEQADVEEETDEATKEKLEKKIAKTHAKNLALIEKFKEIANLFPKEMELRAVCDFYDKGGLDAVKKDTLWSEVEKKPTVNVSFLVEGRTKIVAENSCLRSLVTSSDQEGKQKHFVCLITGEQCDPVATTTPTAIAGGNPTGSRLVAFQVNSGYDSYGKSKGLNAPMSKDAEAAYTTALNRLLAKGSHNKFMLGNRTFAFWASSSDEASQKMEESLFDLLGFSDENDDDPNAKIEEVRKVFKAISTGVLKTNLDDHFYILGLAPNSARIAVVYWSESSLRDFAAKIEQHFSDMEIVDNRKERKPYMGLRNMLSTVTQSGKLSDVTPNLPESVAKSIFEGTPYPYTLFSSCIRRIRAESGDIRITRAACKKCLFKTHYYARRHRKILQRNKRFRIYYSQQRRR